jgi:hypothetical protein
VLALVAILLAGFPASVLSFRFKMLPYILSILVGTGSIGMYLAALFVPEIYRRSDPLWSGVGLFYGLVLWVEADQFRGGLLLGQALSVLLLGWFVGQTLLLRRQNADPQDRTVLPEPLEKLCSAVLPNPTKETAWIEIRQEFPQEKTFSSPAESTTKSN